MARAESSRSWEGWQPVEELNVRDYRFGGADAEEDTDAFTQEESAELLTDMIVQMKFDGTISARQCCILA